MANKKTFRPDAYHVCAPKDLSKRWYVFYYDQDGKRQRFSKGINKHKTARARMNAAEEIIEELKQEFKKLRYLSATEKDLLAWLADGKGGWRKSTYVEYASIINIFCKHLDGVEANEENVKGFLNGLKGKKNPTTWNKYRNVLRRCLKAIGCRDYFENLPLLRASSTPAKYFQKNQRKILGEYLAENEPELWLFVQFLFFTFIRPRELRALKVGDIMFDEGEIRVPSAISKNKKTQNVLILPDFLPTVMKLQNRPPGQFIFTKPNGDQISNKIMYWRHRRALDHLEFGEGYTLYSWKHTGAISLFKKGVPVKEIMLQMRHHSLDQTDEYLRQLGVRDVVNLKKVSNPIY